MRKMANTYANVASDFLQTGDSPVLRKKFFIILPNSIKIGKYTARVIQFGQLNDTEIFPCNKCLEKGETFNNSPYEWKCRTCNKSGHRMIDCLQFFKQTSRPEK